MSFSPKPNFRFSTPDDLVRRAFDQPFTWNRALGENIGQGILDSFGLGTAVRDFAVPRGETAPLFPEPSPLTGGDFGPYGLISNAYEGLRNLAGLGDEPSKVLSEDEYKASPFFRDTVPFDPGMTETRAAALAEFADLRAVRAYFSQKQPIAAFAGQLFGQAFDPINYVPVFGPAARVAAVARLGGIRGRALLGASEAALNTAAFGVLTAKARERLGDDISFNVMAMEIAMSALIGGAFGTGIALLPGVRRADAAVIRERLNTVSNTQRAAIPLNEAIDGLATDGEVRLSPNGIDVVERVRAEVVERTSGDVALRAETAHVTGSKPGEVVIAPNGTRVNVQPEVVELSSLVRAEGAMQVRNRNTAASAAQIEDIAINLDGARLMPNIAADQGAPLVGRDNVIDSGNGRVSAIQRATEAYPEKYAEYRQSLEDAGYSTEGFSQPVLINRRLTDLSGPARAQFNADANASSTARMSAVEIGMMDRAAMSADVLDVLADGPVTGAQNRAFVSRFLAKLPQNERGALIAEDGVSLNADGVRRVENALMAEAYGDDAILRRFAEATDDNTRAIVGAMSDVAGKWTLMRRATKSGEIDPDFDATPELTEALQLIGRWRDQAASERRAVSVVIREGMAQLDLLSGEVSPEAQVFIRMFYRNDHFAVATGREALAGRFGKVVDSAFELGRPQLFADTAPVTKVEMLRNATDDLEADIFALDDAGTGAQEIGQVRERLAARTDRGGDRQGTGQDDGGGQPAVDQPSLELPRPIDMTGPKPEPVPEGLAEAEARVGRPEAMRDLADQHGVDLTTGEYVERADIEQLREQSRLSPEDEAELDAADEAYDVAESYGQSLKAAIACVV